jgi:hypothetical protein
MVLKKLAFKANLLFLKSINYFWQLLIKIVNKILITIFIV